MTTTCLVLFLVIPLISMNGPDTPAERLRKTLAGFAYSSTNVKNANSASSLPPQSKPASPKAEARPSDMPGLGTPAKRSLVRKERSDGKDEDDTTWALPQRSPPKKPKRSYADPSVYSHLRELNDYLRPGLDGQRSATLGHHFANPTNHFWSCLYEAGFTSTQLKPSEDFTLPDRFNLGMTNLISRPTAEAAELSKAEMRSSVPTLLCKIVTFKPKIVCVVGVGIAEAIHSYFSSTTSRKSTLSTKAKAKTTSSTTCNVKLGGPGLLPFKLVHDLEPPADSSTASASDTSVAEAPSARGTVQETLFYAVSSTSGRVVRYQKSDKIKQFQEVKALLVESQQGQASVAGARTTATSGSSVAEVNDIQSSLAALASQLVPIYASKLKLAPE